MPYEEFAKQHEFPLQLTINDLLDLIDLSVMNPDDFMDRFKKDVLDAHREVAKQLKR